LFVVKTAGRVNWRTSGNLLGRFFNLATGVVAWTPFRRPSVLRTQVPGVALVLLLLRVGVFQEIRPMATDFKPGDHVEWSSRRK
jgi:hypothetical protein